MAELATAQSRPAPGRLLKLKDVVREISVHRATIYRWVEQGRFPAPLRLSSHRVAWAERDIEAWKASLERPPA